MPPFPNITTLVAFVSVAREGSVSRAAEHLNLTQPAVSHQLRRLSEETGLTLFSRTPGGLALTHDGAALVPKAEQVLATLRDFQRSAHQRLGRISGRLAIGTIVDPEFIRLGALLAQLRNDQPDIETELIHGVSGDMLGWLNRGRIDAGFYLCGPDELSGISHLSEHPVHAVKLANFTYRVIAPSGWDTQIEDTDWKDLATLPWIGTPKTSVHHRLLSRIFDAYGCRPNVVAKVDQEASMLEMVRSGVGLSLCRESIALHQKQSSGLAVCDSVSVPACLCMIALERNMQSPILTEVFKLLNRLW
ncbi:MAG: LysR family transcriptional regulator [Pelagimonas sp.]|jgi:DNA-binding transcriptional LysR family regulator|nr:LysR family transcriptional regulator [Pelagimonas sp.]